VTRPLRRSSERSGAVGRVAGAALALLALVTGCAVSARAEDATGAPETLAQQHLNPLADTIKLPAMLEFGFGFGPERNVQPTLNFQPVIPFKLTEDWRIVTRSNLSIIHLPDPEETTGLSDLDVSLFLTPATDSPWVWGIGPIFEFPTATDTTLGTGKWSTGPTGALVYVNGPWVNGIVVSQFWSFAGPGRRADVSLMQIEVLVSYTFSNNWYVQTDPTFVCDWKAPSGQKWTVPIGIDIGRVVPIRTQSRSFQVGAYYNVNKPDGAADWILRAQVMWAF